MKKVDTSSSSGSNNSNKHTIPKATLELRYISFYHALALLYGYKEEYFYNILKDKNQSIEHIRSVVVLHDLPENSKQNNKPTYDYNIDKLIDEENIKEQNKTYNKFDNLYSQFHKQQQNRVKNELLPRNF